MENKFFEYSDFFIYVVNIHFSKNYAYMVDIMYIRKTDLINPNKVNINFTYFEGLNVNKRFLKTIDPKAYARLIRLMKQKNYFSKLKNFHKNL